jgi:hypothetical protein
MGAIKKLNAIRTIKYTGWVAGLLYPFLDLLYVPEALVGRVEVVGGIWILLVTWGALLAGRLPRALNYLGVVVGMAGVLTVVPALGVLGIGFRLGEIAWIVWLGIVWVRGSRSAVARRLRAFFAARFGKCVATTQDPMPTRGES